MNNYALPALALLMLGTPCAVAQTLVEPEADSVGRNILETLEVKQDLTSHTTDLFGDAIDPSFGSLQFTQVDIDIKGNFDLPVQVVRTLSGPDGWYQDTREFASWSLSLPHVRSTLVGEQRESLVQGNWITGKACSGPLGVPNFEKRVNGAEYILSGRDFWSGDSLSIPGVGSEKIILDSNGNKTTKAFSKIACTINADGSEGFRVTDNNGNNYYLNKLKVVGGLKYIDVPNSASSKGAGGGSCVTDPCEGELPPGSGPTLNDFTRVNKYSIFMLPSKVVDRFGNWVKYDYSGDNISRIYASDGREISFTFQDNRVDTITANNRVWRYLYDDKEIPTLKQATRPDNKSWFFYHEKTEGVPGANFWQYGKIGERSSIGLDVNCQASTYFDGPFIAITHPDGAKASFTLRQTYHGRTEVAKEPRNNPSGYPQDSIGYHQPKCANSFSLIKKNLQLNSNNNLTWLYSYSQNLGAFIGETKSPIAGIESKGLQYGDLGDLKRTTIINPDGSYEDHYFNMRGDWSENKLVAHDILDSSGGLLQRKEYSYTKRPKLGFSYAYYDFTSGQNSPESVVITTLANSDIIASASSYTSSIISFNSYDKPVVTKQLNSWSAHKRWIRQHYIHNTSLNLLNLDGGADVSDDGSSWSSVNRTDYQMSGAGVGNPYRTWTANKHIATYSYHPDGTLRRADYPGSNRYEKFENYYRGKARKITLPCATTNGCTTVNGSTANTMVALLEVNADGTTKSVTDFNGNKVSYSYNPIGWLTKIDYADPKWADKVISYATVTTANDGISGSGIAAGSLRQSISQGNYEKRVYHDALLRPIFTRERDIANGATTRYQAFEYDHENRQTLASFPSSNAASRVGMATEYDALGRIVTQTRTSDNSSSSRDYLAGNKVAVTDSEGNTTTTTYLAYGQPTYDKPLLIEAPNTDDISLDYNEFAQVTSIRQGNITEKRLYDSYQQLCKSIRPETGITAYGYNAQRQQIWRALGTNGSSTSCDAASVPASHKTLLGYDNLGQLRTENFPDTTPDRTYNYDANGNLRALTAGNISWSYLYNSQNAIDKETLSLDGKSFVLDWEYNNLGAVSSLKYPSGALVDFAPNALGQATKAGSYVTGVSYHPNGQVKQFTFGNGIVRNVEMDTSGRIDLLTDSKSGVIKNKLDPSYDGNDNLVRLIDWVDRNNDIDNLVYDGVDRLLSADGRWGTGRYTYDGKGNILSRTLNNVNIGYSYNNLNQLSKLSGAYAYGYQYDTRGNVIHNGRYPLSYNLGQQMVSAKGINYSYDGHNRRVRKTESGKNSYSVYSQGGLLLHRVSENGKKTDSIYLGKTIVAEVDDSASSAVVPAPTVSINISDTMISGECPPKQECFDIVDVPAHRIAWSSTSSTSCSGTIQKYRNGINMGTITLVGTSGTQTELKNGTVYNISVTCTGNGGSKSVTATASGGSSGSGDYM